MLLATHILKGQGKRAKGKGTAPASPRLPASLVAPVASLRETFPPGKGKGQRAKGKGTALFPAALKGPPNIAQGETLGFAVQTESQALKGRPKISLVPKLHLGTHLPGQLRCPRAHKVNGSPKPASTPLPFALFPLPFFAIFAPSRETLRLYPFALFP